MTFTVGIAGVTGKFSTLVLQKLLQNPDVAIRGFCRNAFKLPESVKNATRVEVIEGDVYNVDNLRKFVTGCDVVICGYLGDNELMTQGQKLLVDACEAEGVPRYFAGDYCFDYNGLEYNQHPAKDPMKIVKEYIAQKKTVKGVHVLIGAFIDTLFSPSFGIWDGKSETLTYWGSGEEAWEMTSYENAAEFVAAVALDPNAVGTQKYLGDRKSILQIAERFEQVHGRKPNLDNKGSLDELYSTMQERFTKDPNNVFAWLPLFYQYYGVNGQTYLGEIDNKYNVKPQTFNDYMRARLASDL